MEEFGLTSLSGRQAPRSVCTPTNKDLGVVVIRDTVTLVVVSDFRRFDPNPLIPWVSGRLEADLMHPVRWCNGCLCGLGSQSSDPYGKMTSEDIYNLPLNVYVIILGIGLFIFMLSLIFCCYMFRLRRQGTREQYGYNEVVLKGAGKKLSLLGQTCAVCLEEFKSRDELGVCTCSHAFHKKCLLKWLEIRSVCPMCNKPICRLQPDPPQGAEGPQSPMEV